MTRVAPDPRGLLGPSLNRPALRALVSGTPSDAHTWNLVYLQLLLEELGCEVSNLGPCVPTELLLRDCRVWRPDVIVLGTVNGHGYNDGLECITALQGDPQTANVPAIIGGKLGISGPDTAMDAVLIDAGFAAVVGDDLDSSSALRVLVNHSLVTEPEQQTSDDVETVR
jgi:methylaspartate mutase sigma subunit